MVELVGLITRRPTVRVLLLIYKPNLSTRISGTQVHTKAEESRDQNDPVGVLIVYHHFWVYNA